LACYIHPKAPSFYVEIRQAQGEVRSESEKTPKSVVKVNMRRNERHTVACLFINPDTTGADGTCRMPAVGTEGNEICTWERAIGCIQSGVLDSQWYQRGVISLIPDENKAILRTI